MRICLHFDEISRREGEPRGRSAVCAGRSSRGKFVVLAMKSADFVGNTAVLDLPKIPLKMRVSSQFCGEKANFA